MRKKKKGSLTVEAAFVVPLCLMVIFCLLTLAFLIHHEARYTQAVWDSALWGSLGGADDPKKEATDRLERLRAGQVLPVRNVSLQVDANGRVIRCRANGSVTSVLGIRRLAFSVKAEAGIEEPAKELFRRAGKPLEEKKK